MRERLLRRARKVALRLTYGYRAPHGGQTLKAIAADLGISLSVAFRLLTPGFDEDHPITDARIDAMPPRPRERMRGFVSTIAVHAERGTLGDWVSKWEVRTGARRPKKTGGE